MKRTADTCREAPGADRTADTITPDVYACFLTGRGVATTSERIEGKELPVLTTLENPPCGHEDVHDLLDILRSMPMTDPGYGQWWNSADGRGLYEQITERIGTPLTASLRNKYGVSYDATDVANSAVMVLRQDFIHAYILRADDPWAYLSSMLKRELAAEAGTHFRAELTDEILYSSAIPAAEPAGVSLHEAAEMTHQVLSPAVPVHLHGALKDAIVYFAELGGARLSHLYTHASIDEELTSLGLVREEILAIANAVLGSRPNNGQTSLLAAYLNDPGFDPRSSIMHRRALNKFSSRMSDISLKQEALVG